VARGLQQLPELQSRRSAAYDEVVQGFVLHGASFRWGRVREGPVASHGSVAHAVAEPYSQQGVAPYSQRGRLRGKLPGRRPSNRSLKAKQTP